jgi:NhaP-type Na+/H+ or K+/H+ antiporter
VLAVAAGTAAGIAGGWLLSQTERRGWTSGTGEQLAILGLAHFAYFGSLAIGGNGFIVAFVAGIVFRADILTGLFPQVDGFRPVGRPVL